MPAPHPFPFPPGRGRPHTREAFSLFELVTVVAILALLAGLLFPALSRARVMARSAMCLHQFRQWGLAFHLYAADHDDRLPPEGTPNPSDRQTNTGWYIQLPRQIGIPRYHDQPWRTNPAARSLGPSQAGIWLCPANPRRSNGRNLFHYCLNQHLDGTGDGEFEARLSSLPSPAALVTLFDSKNLPAVGGSLFTHTNLHSAGAQFLFLDGHARRLRALEYWDPASDRPRTNAAGLRWIP